jgi:cation:H+ antiporter
LTVVLLVGGLIALLVGAEVLVRGGTGLAGRLGIPPMVIGLTVVSIGTSLPELAVGIDAARGGSPALAVGNIVGANLVNLLFILGLAALLLPVAFERRSLRFDLPAMVVAALVLYLLARDGSLGPADGILLMLGGVVYTVGVLHTGRRDPAPVGAGHARGAPEGRSSVLRLLLVFVIGVVAVLVGAQLLVDGAVDVAHALGVSEAVIGLTIVAIGTTAPELVTTLVSTIRGERDMAIGNLLGSSPTTSPSSWVSPSSSPPPGCRFRRRCSHRISCCWWPPRWPPCRSCSRERGSGALREVCSSQPTSGTWSGSSPPAPRAYVGD